MELNEITEKIIGAAIEVHRHLGPGLLESAYEECLCFELSQNGLSFQRQVELPVVYKKVKLDCGYRMDIVVEDAVVVELKTVEKLVPIHSAQLLTHLKLSGKQIGLLLNFNEAILKKGIKRLVNHLPEPYTSSASSAPESRVPAELSTAAAAGFSRVTPRLSASAVNKEPR
jgi:GxxExxY protein